MSNRIIELLNNGYHADIRYDEAMASLGNPCHEDCEPPLAYFYDSSFNGGPSDLNLKSLFQRLPEQVLSKNMIQIGKIIDFDIVDYFDLTGWTIEELQYELLDKIEDCPKYGGSGYIDSMASICKLLGYPFKHKTLYGSCQGEVFHTITVATPEWIELVGVPPDSIDRQLGNNIELMNHWINGNCFYVSCITDPDGYEIDLDHGLGSFWGDDFNESGLIEECNFYVAYDIKEKEKEALHRANIAFFGKTSMTPKL